MALNPVTTSFLVSNLHCPSCISHIQDTLALLKPAPVTVSPSLVSSWVTVAHESSLSPHDIEDALENAGFEICDVVSDTVDSRTRRPSQSHLGHDGYVDEIIDRLGSHKKQLATSSDTRSSRHVANCHACQLEAVKEKATKASKSLPQENTREVHAAVASEMCNKQKSTPPLVIVDSSEPEKLWQASLAVGGMTCAACASTITEELGKKPWVKKVAVNLISNSATVDFVDEHHKNEIVEIIEGMGYDTAIDRIIDYDTLRRTEIQTKQRTVEILVEGMFCEHCPSRILKSLDGYGEALNVDKPIDSKDPIMRIIYTPRAPDFTIRNIIAAIASVDPAICPSIYHPPTLEERSRKIHRREQWRMLVRVILTLVIAIPTLIIGIVYMSLVSKNNHTHMFLDEPLRAGISRAQWSLFIMATPVYFFCADVFHKRSLKEIRVIWRPGSTVPIFQRFYRFGSMNMLMSVGTSIAYISSLAQLIAAGLHPPEMTDNSLFYFDSVIFLTLFLLVGRLIEMYSKSKIGDAVTMLGKLRPNEAFLVESTSETLNEDSPKKTQESLKIINVDLLEFGDIVKVLHGGSPPCDGTVVSGVSKFDESSLTGESRLIKKSIGDDVFSGTINRDSPVSVKITGVGGASMLDQILKAVREGQTRRAPMERIADRLTSIFVPIVTVIGIVTWLFWLGMAYSGSLPADYFRTNSGGPAVWSLEFAISVFVVACPCGLALAAPTALFVGGGMAAKHGILAKGGGEAFEKASKLNCIVFDKTGTLTIGNQPKVTGFELAADNGGGDAASEEIVLGMIKVVEMNSSHTVAKALVTFCQSKKLKEYETINVDEIPGKGMKGTFRFTNGQKVEIVIGNELLLLDMSVEIADSAQSILESWKSRGTSVALAAIKISEDTADSGGLPQKDIWRLVATFAISDPLRPEAPDVIKALRKCGIDVWMLSGDNIITSNAIGALVGIPASNIIAGVLPDQKAEKIQYLQKSLKARHSAHEHTQKRALVAMVGDGINDSPALTTADVGIAIGSGSEIAISSADFVLVSSNLNGLITLLELSKVVIRRIKFNFGWALIYNLIALPIAAGVLYPIVSNGVHVRLDPVWASLAMAASSVSVVVSSLALQSRLPGLGFKLPIARGAIRVGVAVNEA